MVTAGSSYQQRAGEGHEQAELFKSRNLEEGLPDLGVLDGSAGVRAPRRTPGWLVLASLSGHHAVWFWDY